MELGAINQSNTVQANNSQRRSDGQLFFLQAPKRTSPRQSRPKAQVPTTPTAVQGRQVLPLPEDGTHVEGLPRTQVSPLAALPAAAARRSGAAKRLDSSVEATVSTAEEAGVNSMLKFQGKIGRCDSHILIDSGAAFNFFSAAFIQKNRMKIKLIDGPRVQLADGKI